MFKVTFHGVGKERLCDYGTGTTVVKNLWDMTVRYHQNHRKQTTQYLNKSVTVDTHADVVRTTRVATTYR